MNVREFFWPVLAEPLAIEDAQRLEFEKAEVASIKAAILQDEHIDVLIDEARRLEDAETARRNGADARATTYLAIVGVLAPILAALTPIAIAKDVGLWRSLFTLVPFAVASAYLLWCSVWCFRALKVSSSARLDAIDLARIWANAKERSELAKGLLVCVRLNRRGVNAKVTCIKMAHEFGVRALMTLVLAILIRSSWAPVAGLATALIAGKST